MAFAESSLEYLFDSFFFVRERLAVSFQEIERLSAVGVFEGDKIMEDNEFLEVEVLPGAEELFRIAGLPGGIV